MTQLGDVLIGRAEGLPNPRDEITIFDSTGLAVRDLAVAVAVYERYRAEPDAPAFEGVVEIDLG